MTPEIELELLRGGRFSLERYRSRSIVMISFWASWCRPCAKELPMLTEVAAAFRQKNVVFHTINIGEDPVTIHRFLRDQNLNMTVASDPTGRVADAYGASSLPTLVLIDREGLIQQMHVGYRPDLKSILKAELETLVAGGSLSGASLPSSLASHVSGEENRLHKAETYKLVLPSGHEHDIVAIFRSDGKGFQQRLGQLAGVGRLLRLKHSNGQPSMLIGRQGTGLRGPTAVYYENGAPMVYLTYNRDAQRDQALFSWDETRRPLIFEQYESGKQHGFSCLFKACSEQCTEGHLWLVEEWRRGRLLKSHLVPDDGVPVTFENLTNDLAAEYEGFDSQHEELAQARTQLRGFHATLDRNEQQLKQSIVRLGLRENRARLLASMASQFRQPGRISVRRIGSR